MALDNPYQPPKAKLRTSRPKLSSGMFLTMLAVCFIGGILIATTPLGDALLHLMDMLLAMFWD